VDFNYRNCRDIPVFVNVTLNNFIVFMGMMGGIFLIPVFASTFMNYTATQTGYLFMPMAGAIMLAAPLGGALTGKFPSRYVIAASTFVAALGLFMFAHLDPRSTAIDIIVPLGIMAFGMGFGMSQRTSIIASVVAEHEIGIASSVLALARNIAGAFGISVFATILKTSTENNLLKIAKLSTLNAPALKGEFIGLALTSKTRPSDPLIGLGSS